MLNPDIEQITKDELQALVDNGVLERKTLEYKQALPSNSDKDKKEFLADVSSFANASGGDLIFGITENKKTGAPKSLDGLNIENPDQEILRLENMIRDGIDPRISSISTRSVPIDNSKVALIVRVPQSWTSPHRVIPNDKFYSRSSNGKYPLDVGELRNAFNLSETITERIRNFRTARISKILANETPVPFYDNPKIVLHLIPIISFKPSQAYDISMVASGKLKLLPVYCSGWNDRYNLEGFMSYSWNKDKGSHSYVQLFRSGIIEAVEGLLLEPHGEQRLIPSIAYERELLHSLTEYLSVLKALNVEPPIVLFLTLLGVKGYSMGLSSRYEIDEIYKIDRDMLSLPEVIIENHDEAADRILKPCFDSVWNACGFSGDFYYNDEGKWASPR
jgi:hypothetical protein